MDKDFVEKRAIEIAMKFEKQQGRMNPKDVSKYKLGYDVESADRYIEVKGRVHKNAPWFSLEGKLKEKLGDKFDHYWVYVIYNIRSKTPKLITLSPEKVKENLVLREHYIIHGSILSKFGEEQEISQILKEE